MSISTFAIKIWRLGSILLLLGALIWTYSVMDAIVAVGFNESGEAAFSVSKDTVFYVIMGIFIVNNILLMSLAKYLNKVPFGSLPVPNRSAWVHSQEEVREIISNWVGALVAAVNTILGLSLFALATVNSKVFNWDVFSFSWIAYVGIAMLVIIIIVLPVRLSRPPVKIESL